MNQTIARVEHIVPFNDVFFRSCYQTAMIVVLKSFNRDIRPLYYSDIHHFEHNLDQNNLYLELLNVIPYHHLYHTYLGIYEKPTLRSADIVKDVIKSIDNGCPVSAFIDRYYQSSAPMYYLKKHSNHTLLLFGYNCEERFFDIVDDYYLSDDSMYTYGKISFEDLEKAYEGFDENYPEFKEVPSYYQYSRDESDYDCTLEVVQQLQENYFSALYENKENMYQALEKLQIFRDDLLSVMHTDRFYKKADFYERMIWWIIQFRKTEQYIYSSLFTGKLQQSLDQVIFYWEQIKTLLLKILIRGGLTDKIQSKLTRFFSEIYELEKNYLDILFSQLSHE